MEVGRAWFSSLYPFVLVCLFLATLQHVELPHQGSDLCPLQWMHGFLTTGPPRGAPGLLFKPLKIKVDLRKGWSGWWPWG